MACAAVTITSTIPFPSATTTASAPSCARYDPYDWLSPSETPVGPEADLERQHMRVLLGALPEEVREVEEPMLPFCVRSKRSSGRSRRRRRSAGRKLLKEKRAAIRSWSGKK